MLAPQHDTHSRICTSCLHRRPLDCFRRFRAGSDVRRPQCRDCRRIADRARRDRISRRDLAARFAEIRRRSAPESIQAIVLQTAEQFGGVNAFAARLGQLLKQGAPPCWTLKCLQSLLHAAAVAERHRLLSAAPPSQAGNPADLLRKLHAAGRLAPLLRQMLAEGTLTLDDLDPPPTGQPPL